MDFFGGKTNLETLNKTQIYTLMFSAFISYFIMILCGTLGAPRFVNEHVMECAPEINNCTLAQSLRNQIQICQSSADLQASEYQTDSQTDSEVVNLSFLFKLDDSKVMGERAFLNTTVAIYDSQD